MSRFPESEGGGTASGAFRAAAAQDAAPLKSKAPPPFSLRLTAEERAKLERAAKGQPLGAYIRAQLFDEAVRSRRAGRAAPLHERLAQILAALGRSNLAANVDRLAKAATAGNLDGSPETARDLRDACKDIRDMREALISALGVKPETGP